LAAAVVADRVVGEERAELVPLLQIEAARVAVLQQLDRLDIEEVRERGRHRGNATELQPRRAVMSQAAPGNRTPPRPANRSRRRATRIARAPRRRHSRAAASTTGS